MDNFDENAAKERQREQLRQQISPECPAVVEPEVSEGGSAAQLIQSDGPDPDLLNPSDRNLAPEENKVDGEFDPLVLSHALPELPEKEQQEIIELMKEEEKKFGSTRSIDAKRSEPKMTTSLDLEEDRGLNPSMQVVPIVEHSQENSQPNLSKNY